MFNLILSVLSLTVLFVLAFRAVFDARFRDNWWQFFGLSGVAFLAPLKILIILDRGGADSASMMLYGAVALYAIGTAIKVRFYSRSDHHGTGTAA